MQFIYRAPQHKSRAAVCRGIRLGKVLGTTWLSSALKSEWGELLVVGAWVMILLLDDLCEWKLLEKLWKGIGEVCICSVSYWEHLEDSHCDVRRTQRQSLLRSWSCALHWHNFLFAFLVRSYINLLAMLSIVYRAMHPAIAFQLLHSASNLYIDSCLKCTLEKKRTGARII